MKRRNQKFRRAFQGIYLALKIENTFKYHLSAAALAIAASIILKIDLMEWCLVLLVIGLVLLSEMFNTVIELLVKLYTKEYHELANKLLNISAGAVLIMSIVAALIGLIIFLERLIDLWKKI